MKYFPLFLALFSCSPIATLLAAPPNIVLIMADDFGYECVSANGGESYQTPHLDRLAAGGMRFEHCHSQPLCTPTRVQLMTGRYNVRNYLNFGILPRTEKTFAHLLRDRGYATGVSGKWQLGREKDSPRHFGFEESILWQQTRRPPRYANPGLELNGEEMSCPQGSYGPDLINDFALDFITRHKDRPFFLYYPMILPHDPFQPTPESAEWNPKARGEDINDHPKNFAAMTSYLDKMVGRLDGKLAELGIRDNTLVLFLGDNGTSSRVTTRFRGKDFRGGKGTTTHRGSHVPLIASWPAVIKTPRTNRDLVGSADFLPTFCEAAGIPIPAGCDGVSFLPQLHGETGNPRDSLYIWYSPRQNADMTVREFAFDHRHKLYRTGEFFDLDADPEEKSNLVAPLSNKQQLAKTKLLATLDSYRDARPADLDRQFEALRQGKPEARTKNPSSGE